MIFSRIITDFEPKNITDDTPPAYRALLTRQVVTPLRHHRTSNIMPRPPTATFHIQILHNPSTFRGPSSRSVPHFQHDSSSTARPPRRVCRGPPSKFEFELEIQPPPPRRCSVCARRARRCGRELRCTDAGLEMGGGRVEHAWMADLLICSGFLNKPRQQT
jgi:hypothetical protein